MYILKYLSIFLLASITCLGQADNNSDKIGILTIEELKDASKHPWFTGHYNKYKVDKMSLKDVGESISDFSFKVFIGTWCSDSKTFLPKFMKIAKYLKIEESQIELVRVNKPKNEPKNLIKKYEIKYVPTVIVFNRFGEANRIVEFVNKSIEKDLSDIILLKKYIPFRE